MESIYANPVEIVKKDIYIIINRINNKVYVGQTSNPAIRFKQHCKPSNMNNSLIGKAINKYGKENFSLHVIEHDVENYNEREKYWIEYYHSIDPFGYNVLPGGDSPPILYGEHSPNCAISDSDLKNLMQDLSDTNMSYMELAKKYGISKRQILRINNGSSRLTEGVEYPIRKEPNRNGKLSGDDVTSIIDLLKYTYLFNGEIAKRFGVKEHVISKINKGESHRIDGETYPIRNWKSSGVTLLSYEQVTEIIALLKDSSLSINKIAKKYNVYFQTIQEINNGSTKRYRRKEIIYPIRNY